MYAFPKSVRLHHQDDFRRVFDEGYKAVEPQVVIYLRARSGTQSQDAIAAHSVPPRDGGTRIGLVVSRKVGNAVVRNRVKRHLREAYRVLRPELEQFACLWAADLVVVARATAARADAAQMATALQHGLRRLKRQLQP